MPVTWACVNGRMARLTAATNARGEKRLGFMGSGRNNLAQARWRPGPSHSTSDATEQGLRLLKFGGGEETWLHVGQLQCVRIACVTGSRIRTVPPPRSLTRRLSCARRIIVGLTLLHTAKNCYVPPRTAATGASEWTTRRPLARARSHRSRIFGTWWGCSIRGGDDAGPKQGRSRAPASLCSRAAAAPPALAFTLARLNHFFTTTKLLFFSRQQPLRWNHRRLCDPSRKEPSFLSDKH